jgi:hypothetical protein
MTKPIETLRRKAERLFLGRTPVIGVGFAEDSERPELVFLLQEESEGTRKSVLRWAGRNHVCVRFVVTGKIKALGNV